MSTKLILAFALTELFSSLTPGPAVLLIVSQGMKSGLKSSIRGIVGIEIVNVLFFALSALGLGAVLIYWGARAWMKTVRAARTAERTVTRLRGASLILVGFIMLGLVIVEFRWVGTVLAVAGAILTLRGLVGAVLSLRAN